MNDVSVFSADRRRSSHITEQAATWYLDLREDGTASREREFLAWLRSSPAHVAEYLAIAKLHGDMKAAASIETLGAEHLTTLAARESSIVSLRGNKTTHGHALARREHRRHARRLWLACASIALLAGVGTLGWLSFTDVPAETYASGIDAVRTVPLSDGSMIQLDGDSAIAVRFDEHRRRIELLRGGAIVDVGKDPLRPLLVTVGNHVLQDIGTVFDVRRDTHDTDVTVIHGRVMVWDEPHPLLSKLNRKLTGTAVTGNVVADLGGGQHLHVGEDGTSTVSPADLARTTSWLPDAIRFQRSTAAEVARRFNLYNERPLIIEDERIAATRISGVFHARDPEAFLAYLGTLPAVGIVREHDRIRIVARADGDGKSL